MVPLLSSLALFVGFAVSFYKPDLSVEVPGIRQGLLLLAIGAYSFGPYLVRPTSNLKDARVLEEK
jgi:hypothetical protein